MRERAAPRVPTVTETAPPTSTPFATSTRGKPAAKQLELFKTVALQNIASRARCYLCKQRTPTVTETALETIPPFATSTRGKPAAIATSQSSQKTAPPPLGPP